MFVDGLHFVSGGVAVCGDSCEGSGESFGVGLAPFGPSSPELVVATSVFIGASKSALRSGAVAGESLSGERGAGGGGVALTLWCLRSSALGAAFGLSVCPLSPASSQASGSHVSAMMVMSALSRRFVWEVMV